MPSLHTTDINDVLIFVKLTVFSADILTLVIFNSVLSTWQLHELGKWEPLMLFCMVLKFCIVIIFEKYTTFC